MIRDYWRRGLFATVLISLVQGAFADREITVQDGTARATAVIESPDALPDAAASATETAEPSTSEIPGKRFGRVTGCQVRPPFMAALNIPADASASTSTEGILGFNVLVPDPKAGHVRSLLHDTWKSAGNLGQFTYDKHGNIYLVPVPLTSLEVNPPQDQNKIYVIDATTGRMREFMDLPAPRPIDTTNPFGTIGITYDCETHSLYVSSLAGSGPAEELGTLFRVDLGVNQVKTRLEGIDVLGLGVFRSEGGKRLYIGSARRGEVLSVPLDAQGDFSGRPRFELGLGAHGLPANYRVQRIVFNRQDEMQVKTLPFAYSLRVIEPEDIVTFTLSHRPGDGWEGQ